EERTGSDGEILTAPSAANLKRLMNQAAAKRPESIAICLLFSFANPKNELAIAEALKSLGVPLSISHQILPEFREYERTSTVVINAYLQPVMQRYLQNLEARVIHGAAGASPAGFVEERRFSAAKNNPKISGALAPTPRIFVMQSTGGITSLASAAREPVR